MAGKQNSTADEPAQVFRQFAWHLAGTLAATPVKESGKLGGAAKPRPAKASGRR